jgi:hypothetical protein
MIIDASCRVRRRQRTLPITAEDTCTALHTRLLAVNSSPVCYVCYVCCVCVSGDFTGPVMLKHSGSSRRFPLRQLFERRDRLHCE